MSAFDNFDVGAERQIADLFAQQEIPPLPTDADPGSFVRKDTVTAKGDLIVGTAAAAVTRQAVGTNGQVLTADSSTSTGVKYATPTTGTVTAVTATSPIASTGGTTPDISLTNAGVTYAKIQNISATDKVLGRSTAGAGVTEEITCTAAGRALIDDADVSAQRTTLGLGTLATQSGTFSGTSSGTNTGDQTITLTGGVTGSGTGSFAATVVTNAALTGVITSVGNATSIASQTGTGTTFVVNTSPTLVTPVLGVATATSINKVAITAPATAATLVIANNKTFTVSNTLTLTATDGSTLAIGSGGTLGTNAYTSTAYVSQATTVNGKALSGNITLSLASADFANQGTTTTVLHGNAAGNPSFASVGINDVSTSTGTGSFVFSASPTFTGTVAGAVVSLSGTAASLAVVNSATSGTNYCADFEATGSTPTANIAVYAAAKNATTNYAIQIPPGFPDVGSNNYAIRSESQAQSYFAGAGLLLPNLPTSSAATTGTMCWTTGTGAVNVDTTTTCLLSSSKFKKNDRPLTAGLQTVLKLRPVCYRLKNAFNPTKLGEQVGFFAEDVAVADARLVSVEKDGSPHAVRYQQLTAVLARAIQEQQEQIRALDQRLATLRKC